MTPEQEKRLAEIEQAIGPEDAFSSTQPGTIGCDMRWLCTLVREQAATCETLAHLCDAMYAELTANPAWDNDGIRRAFAALPEDVRKLLSS